MFHDFGLKLLITGFIWINIGSRGNHNKRLFDWFPSSPPLLEDVHNINVWLREIKLQKCVTEFDDQQQGPAVYLFLPYNGCKACIDVYCR